MQGADVLPVLLEQRHEEVHGEVNVLDEVLLGHAHVTDGHRQAQDLGDVILKDRKSNLLDYLRSNNVQFEYFNTKLQRAGYSN